MTGASTCGPPPAASSPRPMRGRRPRPSRASDRALELQLAVLGLDDEGAEHGIPLDRGAERDQEVVLLIGDRLFAALARRRQRERSDREFLLPQRIGRRRKGVAAAETAHAELLVEDEGRALARERLAVERHRRPGDLGREGLVLLRGRALVARRALLPVVATAAAALGLGRARGGGDQQQTDPEDSHGGAHPPPANARAQKGRGAPGNGIRGPPGTPL